MQTRMIRAAVIGVSMMIASQSPAVAAGKERVDQGRQEYTEKCAVCHGKSGKGDGGLIDVLNRAPSDLTVLTKRNGGVFPFERTFAVIDGRTEVKGHGTREMPVWGTSYQAEGQRAAEYYFDMPYDMEMYVRMRLFALIDYIHRLQVK